MFFLLLAGTYTNLNCLTMPTTLQGIAPLPKELEIALKECFNREQQHLEPVVTCTYNTTLALLQRGMLSAKTIMKRKKALFGFYVTDLGIDYLSQAAAL
jgi:hypothetical protein